MDKELSMSENEARLIAAAPDLLAALKEAERYLEYLGGETAGQFFGPGMPSEALAMTRAAVSKATGRGITSAAPSESCRATAQAPTPASATGLESEAANAAAEVSKRRLR